tara:strand:- start:1144 stop:1629 length:486 start_codon:yes stop_codon:yes gene_type:complete
MKKVIIQKERKTRKIINELDNSSNLLNENTSNEIILINKLYINEKFENSVLYVHEIKKKINGYRNQDIKKDKLNIIISYEETLEKLVESQLKCYYCKEKVCIIYKKIREPKQWTLDRLNNNIGHNKENTVICCLDCNLKRRVKNHEDFKFTKQLIIKKTNN